MTMTMTMTLPFFLIFMELIIVSWVDIKRKKISNRWIVLNIVASVLFHLFLPKIYPFNLEIFLFPLGFFVLGLPLYLLGIMGAGDSKLLASLFLVTPLEHHQLFFEKIIYSTIITGSILVLIKVYKNSSLLKVYLANRHWTGIREILSSRFSYAPIVCMGWLLLGLTICK